ncbi:MAG: methyltransferase family protein [Nitrospinota bacterium]
MARLRLLLYIPIPFSLMVLFPYLAAKIGRELSLPSLGLGALSHLGLIFFIPGTLLGLWCMGLLTPREGGTPAPYFPPRKLVLSGPYLYVRNPMILGNLTTILGEALYFDSLSILLYLIILWPIAHLFVLGVEEPQLRARFGQDYLHYAEVTPRWLPRPRLGKRRRIYTTSTILSNPF